MCFLKKCLKDPKFTILQTALKSMLDWSCLHHPMRKWAIVVIILFLFIFT